MIFLIFTSLSDIILPALVTAVTLSAPHPAPHRDRMAAKKHGMSNTPEWHAYYNARGRCNDANAKAWEHYGGREIRFRFRSLEEFLEELDHASKVHISGQKFVSHSTLNEYERKVQKYAYNGGLGFGRGY